MHKRFVFGTSDSKHIRQSLSDQYRRVSYFPHQLVGFLVLFVLFLVMWIDREFVLFALYVLYS